MAWIADDPDGVTVTVWAVPGASRSEIVGLHDGALRVRLAAPPEGGGANEELRRLLKAATGARSVTLVTGATARRKTLLLSEISIEEAEKSLIAGDA